MLIPGLTCLSRDEKLVYRGEGNSSLVIALKNERKVIRLLKADSKQLKTSLNGFNEESIESILQLNVRFVGEVIPLILSPKFFFVPQLEELTENQIQRIRSLVHNKRPSHRLQKKICDSRLALLLPDYCQIPRQLQQRTPTEGPVIAVEIKPKQGFLPSEQVLSDWLKVKSRVCRYCLSQFHKLKKGSIVSRSEYCPLDLFSGCPQRQRTALLALIESPQNNFRVFRDINYVYGEDLNESLDHVIRDFCDSRETFIQLLLSSLALRVGSHESVRGQQQFCALHNNGGHRCQCDVTDHALPKGSVLGEILSAQRLDSIDSEVASDMLDAINAMANNNDGDTERHLQSIPRNWRLKDRARDETQSDYYLRKVWQFLVSLTAKDCSIMVSMQRMTSLASEDTPIDHVIRDSANGRPYLCIVCVTDLDQKCSQKIRRTLSNDKRMVTAFNTQ